LTLTKGSGDLRQLKRYKPTGFMAAGSKYNKALADKAIAFIYCLPSRTASFMTL
jgi:hypothetical protein